MPTINLERMTFKYFSKTHFAAEYLHRNKISLSYKSLSLEIPLKLLSRTTCVPTSKLITSSTSSVQVFLLGFPQFKRKMQIRHSSSRDFSIFFPLTPPSPHRFSEATPSQQLIGKFFSSWFIESALSSAVPHLHLI